MNATFQTIDPGSQEVLAAVSEMERRKLHGVVGCITARFRVGEGRGCRKRIVLVMKLVELCESDRDVLLACEIFDGGKVSELAEGDFTQIRACRVLLRSGPADRHGRRTCDASLRRRQGLHLPRAVGRRRGDHPELSDRPDLVVHVPALLAGNSVLIKPAEDTLLSALYIGKLAEEAAFLTGLSTCCPAAARSPAAPSPNTLVCGSFRSRVRRASDRRSCAPATGTALG